MFFRRETESFSVLAAEESHERHSFQAGAEGRHGVQEELLECGEPRIHWMYEHLRKSGSQAVMYRNDGLVCTESLALPYILLLEQIRDGDGKDYLSGTGLTGGEVREFLLFALQEGILVNVN